MLVKITKKQKETGMLLPKKRLKTFEKPESFGPNQSGLICEALLVEKQKLAQFVKLNKADDKIQLQQLLLF